MWNDFKKFAMQGNVFDLAIAVIIGGAFGKIVNSLVENIIMPLLGILLQGLDFTQLSFTVGDAVVSYGVFIQSVIDFLIISLSIFFFIRLTMKLKRKKEEEKVEAAPEVDAKEELLKEIRDLLKEQASN